MNITGFASGGEAFVSCECVKGFAYKNAAIGAKCALLPVICADFGLSRDIRARFQPHRMPPASTPPVLM